MSYRDERTNEKHHAWLLPAGTRGLCALGWLLVSAATLAGDSDTFDGEWVLVGKPKDHQMRDFVTVGVKCEV